VTLRGIRRQKRRINEWGSRSLLLLLLRKATRIGRKIDGLYFVSSGDSLVKTKGSLVAAIGFPYAAHN
jgi:hypothetical protein